jgi:hypothetical protein
LIFQNIVRFKAGGKAKAGAFAYAWGKRSRAKAGAFAYAWGKRSRAKAGAFAYDGKKWLYEPSEWGYQWKDINDN